MLHWLLGVGKGITNLDALMISDLSELAESKRNAVKYISDFSYV